MLHSLIPSLEFVKISLEGLLCSSTLINDYCINQVIAVWATRYKEYRFLLPVFFRITALEVSSEIAHFLYERNVTYTASLYH